MRLPSKEAASRFIERHFPNCNAAILSGSVVLGLETERSDLDLVVLDDSQSNPFRASYFEFEWPIEAFVVTKETYRYFFEISRYEAIPSLQRMCATGVIVKDDGSAEELIREAKDMLQEGPYPWTEEEMRKARYEITECLEDLTGSASHDEDMFIVNRLAGLVHEFVLRVNGRWIGEGKWAVRSLKQFDEAFCRQFLKELDLFYKTGQKENLTAFVDRVLEPYGGRFFAGFRQEG
jgi:predicted nucleotidyltransferase